MQIETASLELNPTETVCEGWIHAFGTYYPRWDMIEHQQSAWSALMIPQPQSSVPVVARSLPASRRDHPDHRQKLPDERARLQKGPEMIFVSLT